MKLFIDPADLKAKYAESPAWLKALMDAWADGLNFYLAHAPEVKPRVITQFEPWMALSFSEGSIGGDIETRQPRRSSRRSTASARLRRPASALDPSRDGSAHAREPTGSNGIAIAPAEHRVAARRCC